MRLMQGEVDKEKGDAEWQREREEARRRDEEKTEKNRKRREKRNAAKKKSNDKKGGGANGNNGGDKGEGMAVDEPGTEAQNAGADGVAVVAETPGVIIHED